MVPANPAIFEEGKAQLLQAAIDQETHSQFIREEYFDSQSMHQALTEWIESLTSYRLKNEARTVKRHLPDVPLHVLTLSKVEEYFGFWRNRPLTHDQSKRMSPHSCSTYLRTFRTFLNWLHRHEKYNWRKPDGLDELKTNIIPDNDAEVKRIKQRLAVQHFTLDQWEAIFAKATPLKRLAILLALNCGFYGTISGN